MNKQVLFLFIILFVLVGCKTVQPTKEVVYQDRVEYIDHYYRDTIFQKETEHIYTQGETVYVDKVLYKYKEVMRYDTIYYSNVDSIYVDRVEYVEKPLKNWQRTMISFGIVVMIAVFVYFGFKIYKHFKV